MAAIVYALCFLTSAICSVLLLRAFRRTSVRLLLWSGLCFVGLALNNALLFVDRVVVPDTDLFMLRTLPAVIGVMLLIFGLTWEAE